MIYVAWLALIVALVAFDRVRRLNKRLETMTQSYWELRYEHSRLKALVNSIDPDVPLPVEEAPPASTTVGFVPLASLKKPPS